MRPRFSRHGVFVFAAIALLAVCLLLPPINAAREAYRRAVCLNNMRELGLAVRCYTSSNNNAYPPSAEVVKSSPDTNKVGGYSFLVRLLPSMEEDAMYRSVPKELPNGDFDAASATNPALTTAKNTSLRQLVCPSNNNALQDPTANPLRSALTNYKAVGASTRNSLLMTANPAAAPPYGTAEIHPDGAVYPSASNLPLANVTDGLSHTIFLMETIDDRASRWMVGAECTLVGLPQASSPTGTQHAVDNMGVTLPFFARLDTDEPPGDSSGMTLLAKGLRTFLMYDFSPSGTDVGKYEDPGWSVPPAYGPSSAHPGVVVVGMGDGSVAALAKKCDANNLFFLITKAGNDPFNLP